MERLGDVDPAAPACRATRRRQSAIPDAPNLAMRSWRCQLDLSQLWREEVRSCTWPVTMPLKRSIVPPLRSFCPIPPYRCRWDPCRPGPPLKLIIISPALYIISSSGRSPSNHMGTAIGDRVGKVARKHPIIHILIYYTPLKQETPEQSRQLWPIGRDAPHRLAMAGGPGYGLERRVSSGPRTRTCP
jgi:hypothetical protein